MVTFWQQENLTSLLKMFIEILARCGHIDFTAKSVLLFLFYYHFEKLEGYMSLQIALISLVIRPQLTKTVNAS